MARVKFTAELVKKFEAPAPGKNGATRQRIYYDSEQAGLALRVTSGGSRAYVVEGSIAGESVRVRLGATSDLTLSQARQRAQGVRGDIAKGLNPNAERKRRQALSVSFAKAFEDYVEIRKAAGRLTPRTEYDYRRILYGALDRAGPAGARKFNGYLSAWRALPIASITPDMVAKKYAELLKRSGAWANHAMRMLSTVCNFASASYRPEGAPLAENPVKVLSQTKAWYRVPRRSSLIRAHELPAWWRAVLELETPAQADLAEVARDYLQLVVLTGLRRGESSRLKWADVDFRARTFTVRKTKNGSDFTLPMTDYIEQLLSRRPREGEYVFPGLGGRGYMAEPKKLIAKVREASGVHFTIHDLRRTFATVAESLDLPAYAIKRLLNHKMAGDVTAGYIVADVERLRAPLQKITDFMLRAAGLRETAPVLELPTRRGGMNG
jgi:integrase